VGFAPLKYEKELPEITRVRSKGAPILSSRTETDNSMRGRLIQLPIKDLMRKRMKEVPPSIYYFL